MASQSQFEDTLGPEYSDTLMPEIGDSLNPLGGLEDFRHDKMLGIEECSQAFGSQGHQIIQDLGVEAKAAKGIVVHASQSSPRPPARVPVHDRREQASASPQSASASPRSASASPHAAVPKTEWLAKPGKVGCLGQKQVVDLSVSVDGATWSSPRTADGRPVPRPSQASTPREVAQPALPKEAAQPVAAAASAQPSTKSERPTARAKSMATPTWEAPRLPMEAAAPAPAPPHAPKAAQQALSEKKEVVDGIEVHGGDESESHKSGEKRQVDDVEVHGGDDSHKSGEKRRRINHDVVGTPARTATLLQCTHSYRNIGEVPPSTAIIFNEMERGCVSKELPLHAKRVYSVRYMLEFKCDV